MADSRFRTPSPPEQQSLDCVKIHLLAPEDTVLRERYSDLIEQHHYLKTDILLGEQLRYLAEVDGKWVALLSWSAAANHLKDTADFCTGSLAAGGDGGDGLVQCWGTLGQ